jgi:hypothetical protein
MPQMEILSIALDLRYPILTRGNPSPSFHFLEKCLLEDNSELGFFSMRHDEISKQVVDFDEKCVRILWVVWLHVPWTNICVRSYKTF